MVRYGKTLRKIRLQKGYTMEQLANGIMSVSFLSKFERGQSDISLHYFVQLLERLAVTYDEFFYIHNNYELDNFDHFFNQAEEAYAGRDLLAIKELKKAEWQKWQESRLDTYLCNTLMLDVFRSILENDRIEVEEKQLEKLQTYLFRVESWGYYELRLYNSTMLLMPPEMVIMLSKTAYNKSARYRGLEKVNKVLMPILLNTVIYLTGGEKEFQYEVEVQLFLTYLENIGIAEIDLTNRNSLLQTKGIYEIRKGNRDKGVKMVDQSISILTQLGAHQAVEEIENYLEILLRK